MQLHTRHHPKTFSDHSSNNHSDHQRIQKYLRLVVVAVDSNYFVVEAAAVVVDELGFCGALS